MWKHLLLLMTSIACLATVWSLVQVDSELERLATHNVSLDGAPSLIATAAEVNAAFAADWQQRDLAPAPPAPELQIVRRLALGLTGSTPSLEEIRSMEGLSPDERVDWYLERLLADRRYSDFVAERLARAFVGTDGGPFLIFRRRRFVHWLSDQIFENRPYDEIVREMIEGEGVWTSNPAVNFVTATFDPEQERPDPVRLAGRVARRFLATRIDCLQCHDDFLGSVTLGEDDTWRHGEQRDFHQLAAFFSEVTVSPLGVRDQENQNYEYQYLDATEEQVVEPRPPFQRELLETEALNRRQQLARWVTRAENRAFGRATVNRVWAMLFSRPLVTPIDSIPLDEELPPGMDILVDDFVAHGYDLKRLIRVMAKTSVFRLDSRAEFELQEQHEAAWAVFPLSRLRPEQAAGAVIQACTIRTLDSQAHILAQLQRFFNRSEFVQRYGDLGEDEFNERGISIPQRLLMMNGTLVTDRTADSLLFNASSQISAFASSDAKAVEATYLACLSRLPSAAEAEYFMAKLENQQGEDRRGALEDLFWILLNSTEFSWNH